MESSHRGTAETNYTRNPEVAVRSLASLSRLRVWCCREPRCRSQICLDPALLWLWHRPAAVAPVRPLAWESPYVAGVALKRKKKKEVDYQDSEKRTYTLGGNICKSHIP